MTSVSQLTFPLHDSLHLCSFEAVLLLIMEIKEDETQDLILTLYLGNLLFSGDYLKSNGLGHLNQNILNIPTWTTLASADEKNSAKEHKKG